MTLKPYTYFSESFLYVDIVKKGTVNIKIRTNAMTILVVNSESFLPSFDSSGSPPGDAFGLGDYYYSLGF
jgi:hypothetical protein